MIALKCAAQIILNHRLISNEIPTSPTRVESKEQRKQSKTKQDIQLFKIEQNKTTMVVNLFKPRHPMFEARLGDGERQKLGCLRSSTDRQPPLKPYFLRCFMRKTETDSIDSQVVKVENKTTIVENKTTMVVEFVGVLFSLIFGSINGCLSLKGLNPNQDIQLFKKMDVLF